MSGRLARIRRIDDLALSRAIAEGRRARSLGPAVGASVWQTPGGVQSEMSRINDGFLAFSHEIFEYLTTHGYPNPTDPVTRGIMTLHDVVWTPLIQAWQKFYGDNSSWWGNLWWNHAPEAESFNRQLLEVRASAKRIGMPVGSPEPEAFAPSILLDPGKNILDETHDAAKKVAESWKIIAAVGAGIGVVGLVLLARSR